MAFSVGEIVDVTFRDEHNPLEVDGSRDMALQDAYRGGSNQGFDITFHPTNWLSAYLAFGEIKAFVEADISTPSHVKPQTGSADPSQIWLVSDASQITLGDGTFGDDASGTNWDITITDKDETNNYIYTKSHNISGSSPAVGDSVVDLSTNSSGDDGTGLTIVGFVHTLKRSPTLPYFSSMGITEEDTTLDYAGCHVSAYNISYTQAGLMQCSMTGESLVLDNDNAKSLINGGSGLDIASSVTGNTGSNFLQNGMYVPCTAGRKVGTGQAKLFRFESEDTTNRPVRIAISTNQDQNGSGDADGLGTSVSGNPNDRPLDRLIYEAADPANTQTDAADWVPYVWSIEMGFSNEFERGPINNDGDANYFLKGNHENSLTLNVNLPNESSSSGTAHRNVATMRTMVKQFGRVNADIQFGLENGQALIVHYRNLKLFGLPRSFENSIRMALNFFVLEQPEMTVVDDAYKWIVLT